MGNIGWINPGAAQIIYIFATNYGALAVTAPDGTNFYVGNTTGYSW